MLRRPQIFISYSKEQYTIAQYLEKELTQKGYTVFYYTESIKVGDSFPKRIESFLKNCEGVIILISNSSLKSEWCRYEYYYSFFKRKISIPIVTEQLDAEAINPLNYFQKDLNYVFLANNTPEGLDSILYKIKDKLEAIKNAGLRKLVKIVSVTLAIILSGYIFFQFGIKQINYFSYNRDKSKLIENIEKSNHIYTTNELKEISDKFSNDQDLAGRLFILSINDKLPGYARLNADIIIGEVLTNFDLYGKGQIENISWNNSETTNNQITNKSFLNGKVENVKFTNVNMTNTSFNNTVLSNLSFSHCGFVGSIFYPKEASVVDFTGCKFYGCTLDVTNFLKVTFASKLSTDPTIIDVSMSTFFENCIFESKFKKDLKNTMDFNRIKAAKLEEINFSNCKFIGYLDKDWFMNCHFYNCIFTDTSILNSLRVSNKIE